MRKITDLQREPWKVADARYKRAQRLGIEVQQWIKLSEQRMYPRSLHDILLAALKREYALGRRKGTPS